MVLYILTGYQVLGIVYLNQLLGARHTHISYHDMPHTLVGPQVWQPEQAPLAVYSSTTDY